MSVRMLLFPWKLARKPANASRRNGVRRLDVPNTRKRFECNPYLPLGCFVWLLACNEAARVRTTCFTYNPLLTWSSFSCYIFYEKYWFLWSGLVTTSLPRLSIRIVVLFRRPRVRSQQFCYFNKNFLSI